MLCSILKQLGFSTLHFVPRLFAPADWSVLDEVDAVADSPLPLLYRECDRRFPGSKFILTTRGLDGWLRSMEWMFTHGRVVFDWGPRLQAYHERLYHTKRFDAEVLTWRWQAYHAEVHDYFGGREDDLLVIDIRQGFDVARICDFLEVPLREIDTATRVNTRRKANLWQRVGYKVRYPLRYVKYQSLRVLGHS
ncbi:hypothetical protein AWN76_015670 [Rhodothermaceae bacterium RA]|nr:hypothetical protein AWN76_015670 [Rhodothermaceae bacterium RA]